MKTYFRVQWRPFEDLLKVPRKTSFTFCAVMSPNFNIGTLRFSDWTGFYQTVVCPGLVFIEKLQNDSLMLTRLGTLQMFGCLFPTPSHVNPMSECVILTPRHVSPMSGCLTLIHNQIRQMFLCPQLPAMPANWVMFSPHSQQCCWPMQWVGDYPLLPPMSAQWVKVYSSI